MTVRIIWGGGLWIQALMHVVDLMKDDIGETADNFSRMRRSVQGLFVNQIEIGLELLVLFPVKRNDLLTGSFKELKFFQVIHIGLPFQKYFFTEEKDLGIIGSIELVELSNSTRGNGENCRSLNP